MGQTKSTASWLSRRKLAILLGCIILTVLLLIVKEKYFYRADGLKAIISRSHKSTGEIDVQVNIRKTETNILGHFGVGKTDTQNKQESSSILNIWDKWMLDNIEYTSIGDIYDKCDNATRTKIGKVVLAPNEDGEGVHITSFVNQTYAYTITKSTSHLKVFYRDNLLYEKDYNMCEQALKLDTPYSCPIAAGQTVIVRDVASMPSYIPKGKYKIDAYITDQDGKEIGCTYAEFKTGEDEEENE